MVLFILILAITRWVELSICIFALYRNGWVLKTRLFALKHKGVVLGDRFPSYDYMLYNKFWIFDPEYFLDMGAKK